MYRIVWCTTQYVLGETHWRDEERLENVILWIMVNHKSLTRLSAGYSVYIADQEGNIGETIWNWQRDKDMCFGKLYKSGFSRMLHMVRGELRIYTEIQEFINTPEIDAELDKLASIVKDVPRP